MPQDDPCRLVRQVNEIQTIEKHTALNPLWQIRAEDLIHLPDEPAGV